VDEEGELIRSMEFSPGLMTVSLDLEAVGQMVQSLAAHAPGLPAGRILRGRVLPA